MTNASTGSRWRHERDHGVAAPPPGPCRAMSPWDRPQLCLVSHLGIRLGASAGARQAVPRGRTMTIGRLVDHQLPRRTAAGRPEAGSTLGPPAADRRSPDRSGDRHESIRFVVNQCDRSSGKCREDGSGAVSPGVVGIERLVVMPAMSSDRRRHHDDDPSALGQRVRMARPFPTTPGGTTPRASRMLSPVVHRPMDDATGSFEDSLGSFSRSGRWVGRTDSTTRDTHGIGPGREPGADSRAPVAPRVIP